MSTSPAQAFIDTWPLYRSNVARHCLGVNTYIQTDVMEALSSQYGYTDLRLSFEPYVSMLARGEASLQHLSRALHISKPAASKTVNQLLDAGYLQRSEGQADRRTRLLQLTDRGKSLIQDGLKAYEETEKKVAASSPDSNLSTLHDIATRLSRQLESIAPPDTAPMAQQSFGSLLARLSDSITTRLMTLTARQGHPRLKLSHAHILSNVGPDGVRMQDVARVRRISKQAVSAIARELVNLGYIHRAADNGSGRQQRLHFTERGEQLIRDSVRSIELLEQDWAEQLGSAPIAQFKHGIQAFYEGLELGRLEFGHLGESTLNDKAQSLIHELGKDQAKELAHILLAHSRGH